MRNFTFLSQKDGLSSYNIHKIIQDNNKFLWIATQDGLNRFDGKDFLVFNKGLEQKRALFSHDITDLVYDSLKEIIWVICNEGGINGIDINTASIKYSIPYNNRNFDSDWRTCAKSINHKIYIGNSSGIEVFNTLSLRFEHLNQSGLSFSNDHEKTYIRQMNADEFGNIWIGVVNKGLMIFDPVQKRIIKSIPFTEISPSSNKSIFWPLCGIFSKDNRYWLGTKNGILKIAYNEKYAVKVISLQQTGLESLRNQEISHICFNSLGLMICGNALLAYKPEQNSILKLIPAGMEDAKWLSDLTYCFEDKEQNIWLGCKQGLGMMKNNLLIFKHVKNTELFGNKLGHLYAVCPINSEQVLVGAKDGLYRIENACKIKQIRKNGLVQNIFRLIKDDIVISGNEGVQLFSHDAVISIEGKYPEFLPYRRWQFNSRIILSDSIIVIGTESNEGILVWNTKKHAIVQVRQSAAKEETGLVSNTINSVFLNKKQEVIALSDYGLTVLNGKNSSTKKIVLGSKGAHKPLGIFMDMAETPGYYWLNAYGEGLVKLDKNFKLLRIFDLNDQISSTQVYKVFNYKDSLLLLTSNNGISIFDLHRETFKKYYEEDGLQNNTFEEACGDELEGIIYAGGVEGFVTINPAAIRQSTVPPRLVITNIKIQQYSNKSVDSSDFGFNSFHIPNDALQTDISFVGMYFSNPTRVRYAYRIKERDPTWIDHGDRNVINLIGVTPGTYTLEVKAENEDGYWSPVKQLTLIFEPKWYQTWLFNLLVALFTAGLLYALYRYRISQIKKQQQIRKDIASDLHDDIGSSLNTVKIFAHLAKKEKGKESHFDQIEISLAQATTSLRDMIWVLDDAHDTVFDLMERIKKFTLPVLQANFVQLETKVESDNYKVLSKKEKRNLLLIAKESINNSLKYAACKSIRVHLHQANSKAALTIRDDGKGFNMIMPTDGNGLKNMQDRARQINYHFEISSYPGKGTLIKLVKK